MVQQRMFAPAFIRLDIRLDGSMLHLEVWEADDARYVGRHDHCTAYPSCTPSDVYELLGAHLDSLGLPDPF